MAQNTIDILLVGYGSVGIIYAYVLEASKRARVTVVARGNYDQLSESGADIWSEKYGDHPGWKPYRTLPSVQSAAAYSYSYVLLATKCLPDLLPTPTLLAPLLTPEYVSKHGLPCFVLLQNGMGIERSLQEKVDELASTAKAGAGAGAGAEGAQGVVLSAAVYIDSNLTDGRVGVKQTGPERLAVGVYTGPTPPLSPPPSARASQLLSTFCSLIRAGGGTATEEKQIQNAKFRKNIWNASVASLCVLSRLPTPAFSRTKEVEVRMREALEQVALEIIHLGQSMGFEIEDAHAKAISREILDEEGKTTELKPSTLVDVERGAPIECEIIVGSLVRWGEERGVGMPRLSMIYALLSAIQAQIVSR